MPEDWFEMTENDKTDNCLEAYFSDGRLHLTIDNPWAGDTETGFGYSTHVSLAGDELDRFKEWLAKTR